MLRQRVKEALGELREPDPTETELLTVVKADELLEAACWTPVTCSLRSCE